MRNRYLVLLLVLALALVAVVGLAGCGSTAEETTSSTAGTTGSTSISGAGGAASGEPIVIGAVVSATGAGSPLGEPERIVLQMLEAKINSAGGVLGRPIKIIIEDDQSAAKDAVTATQKLIQQDKVVAVIGGTVSASTLAMKEVVTAAKIPQLAMAASNAITDPPIDWVWRTPAKDAIAAARALKSIQEDLKVTKIAILHDENAFGASGAAEIEKSAKSYGLEIVAKESYKTDETDLTAQLTKIKGKNPEALVVWGTNPGPAIAAKNMKQLGMTIPYVGSHGIANLKFIELAGTAADGVIFPAARSLLPESITDPAQKKATDEFVAEYKAKTGQQPSTFAGHAWDALYLLTDAITRANSTEPADIQKALNETKDFAGPDGIYNYTATDHDGLTVDDMVMVKIESGKWVLAK